MNARALIETETAKDFLMRAPRPARIRYVQVADVSERYKVDYTAPNGDQIWLGNVIYDTEHGLWACNASAYVDRMAHAKLEDKHGAWLPTRKEAVALLVKAMFHPPERVIIPD